METSDVLAERLRNMVVDNLQDRIVCDKSAIMLMVLEQEIQFLRKQLQEVQNESV